MATHTEGIPSNADDIIEELFEIDAIRFGEFKLKSGALSPIYFNLRVIIGYPKLLRQISELLYQAVEKSGAKYSLVCGVPYTALPIATCMSLDHDVPMVIRRREAKDYGTKQMIEGVYKPNEVCLVVEDVVTTGGSVFETAKELNNVNLKVTDAVVLLDRQQGGKARLKENNINLYSILTMGAVLDVLLKRKRIDENMNQAVHDFINKNQVQSASTGSVVKAKRLSFQNRLDVVKNPVAKNILQLMQKKQTNLCLSVDLTTSKEVLEMADKIGPHICILKTHVDILTDFSEGFITSLKELAIKHEFIIFEDRKFADIGSTVKNQYAKGVYKINKWADLTNAHAVPGDGVVKGLKEVAGENRACLLIAQMSSAGALTDLNYSKQTVAMSKAHSDFVIGFISTSVVCDDPQFLHMTPGVSLKDNSDKLGQQYLTPEEVVDKRGCDVIIVGRGIITDPNPVETAIKYKNAGYEAYMARLTNI